MIKKEKQKGHYDQEALIGWNSAVLLAKMWSELCEQNPLFAQVWTQMWLAQVLGFGIWKGKQKG